MIKKNIWSIWNMVPNSIRVPMNVRRRASYWRAAGVIFVHVPKAAGTSISHALYGRSLGHIKAVDIIKYSTKETRNLYKFAFVRNPWDRAVSAYHFAIGGGTIDAGMTNSKVYQGQAFSSFENFVRDWLALQDLEKLDPVFRCQSDYLCNEKNELLVDYIGYVETIDQDINNVARETGIEMNLKKMNQTARADYKNYYNCSDLVQLIENIYKRDINNFGYRFCI